MSRKLALMRATIAFVICAAMMLALFRFWGYQGREQAAVSVLMGSLTCAGVVFVQSRRRRTAD